MRSLRSIHRAPSMPRNVAETSSESVPVLARGRNASPRCRGASASTTSPSRMTRDPLRSSVSTQLQLENRYCKRALSGRARRVTRSLAYTRGGLVPRSTSTVRESRVRADRSQARPSTHAAKQRERGRERELRTPGRTEDSFASLGFFLGLVGSRRFRPHSFRLGGRANYGSARTRSSSLVHRNCEARPNRV